MKNLLKRSVDIITSLLILAVVMIVFVVVYIIIKRKLGSPVFFKQQRPGLHGRPFYLYKFRTMTDEKDSAGNLLPASVRLTKTGRLIRSLSLDELPQLINVLKGDISLVGPRPLLMEYLQLYSQEQARRHEVKPGITGWAQVNGRNAISWEEKFAFDVWYVDHSSIWLDVKILCMTLFKVIRRDGINQSENHTMEKFKGSQKSVM
ncbi:sugar transferase [Aureibacillus halotolerans]|uniref:Sugar transferase EpsL n=1 Tax=Aureibacillus halotolerans TaxID=1508390 RepID=A0A4R6TWM4_9BACI|nr:sugar transferase [Aureibacillus halotolerans]TDQ37656.1 sugar transferase EpsL [Aureibacillus halotolerans]